MVSFSAECNWVSWASTNDSQFRLISLTTYLSCGATAKCRSGPAKMGKPKIAADFVGICMASKVTYQDLSTAVDVACFAALTIRTIMACRKSHVRY